MGESAQVPRMEPKTPTGIKPQQNRYGLQQGTIQNSEEHGILPVAGGVVSVLPATFLGTLPVQRPYLFAAIPCHWLSQGSRKKEPARFIP